ncbi:hypothetical protein RND81_12G015300 [Saponaria officinalis]|uniref:Strictosidine synthase conserved region domain-containing protein n=1 Tax=Saponaria officinalis TaxID=3572 RepID=A0AAW1H287_SAPOF
MVNTTNIILCVSTIVALSAIIVLNITPYIFPAPLSTTLDHLSSATSITITGAFGPESLAFDPTGSGPYVGVADGRVLKWSSLSNSWVDFAFTSSHRDECTRPFAPELEHVCGRPLGLRFEKKSGNLYIADAYFGLHVVGPEGGLSTKVATEAEGQPFYFTNDMDIDEDEDVIYFTDSSSTFRRRHFMLSILTGDTTGRFMKYDKSTKNVTVLLRNLAFPNGVSLSADRSFVLVAETRPCRILRYWLTGPNSGKTDTFAELPGYPDNIRRNEKGEFWVGLHAKKTRLANWLLKNPWVGKSLLPKLPLSFRQLHVLFVGGHHGIAVKLSTDGRVVEILEDRRGEKVRYISEVEEKDEKLWIGSVLMPSIWVYDLH